MRPVEYYKWCKPEGSDYKAPYEKVLVGIATFHCFSVDYEEFEAGPANYAVAVIELPDGEVKTVPADLIRFTDQR